MTDTTVSLRAVKPHRTEAPAVRRPCTDPSRWWVLAAVGFGASPVPVVLSCWPSPMRSRRLMIMAPTGRSPFRAASISRRSGDFWNNVDFTTQADQQRHHQRRSTAVIAVLLSLLNAYAIGIGRIRGGNRWMLVLLLIGIMIPHESLDLSHLLPLQGGRAVRHHLGGHHRLFGAADAPSAPTFCRRCMSAFPREIIEAAEMDGATPWKILWTIVVPMLMPTLAVLATFFFIWTWNEFLLPLVLLVSNYNQTVSVSMGILNGQFVQTPTTTAAAALLGIAPTLIFFLIFQRTLTRGIAVGAVK